MTELADVQSVLVMRNKRCGRSANYGYLNHQLAWKRRSCEMLDGRT